MSRKRMQKVKKQSAKWKLKEIKERSRERGVKKNGKLSGGEMNE